MAFSWPWLRSKSEIVPASVEDPFFYSKLFSILRQEPLNLHLYEQACTHRSITEKSQKPHNERLEFLGDAVLGACAAQYLLELFPDESEGALSLLRSKLVSRKQLNDLAKKIGLPDLVKFQASRGTEAKSVYGNALEALIGALFLDRGFGDCYSFVSERLIADHVNLVQLKQEIDSYKSHLLEWSQKQRKRISFSVEQKTGEAHAPQFLVLCSLDGKKLSWGKGGSKKAAEEEAAKKAYELIGIGDG